MSLYAGMMHASGYSDIGLARNQIFNGFVHSEYEWLICIDSDIGFTRDDMEYLLAPCGRAVVDGPTLAYDVPRDSLHTILAVNAPYSKKNESGDAVVNGLGFSCINKSVLVAIMSYFPFPYKDTASGQMMQDFCMTGAAPNYNLLREDTGFWFLVGQVGVQRYLQSQTKLRHYGGRHCYELNTLMVDDRG